MSVAALFKLRDDVVKALTEKAADLQKQLASLTGEGTAKRGRPLGRQQRRSRPASRLKGRKVPAQFRSKKDSKLTWSGRGATPRWMKAEMKGTKLTKESFRIK